MSELNYESVSKMKVAELRSALEDHGLDSKGTKPILVARLQSYMENQPSQNAEPGNRSLECTLCADILKEKKIPVYSILQKLTI